MLFRSITVDLRPILDSFRSKWHQFSPIFLDFPPYESAKFKSNRLMREFFKRVTCHQPTGNTNPHHTLLSSAWFTAESSPKPSSSSSSYSLADWACGKVEVTAQREARYTRGEKETVELPYTHRTPLSNLLRSSSVDSSPAQVDTFAVQLLSAFLWALSSSSSLMLSSWLLPPSSLLLLLLL